jgi:peptidoglycan hydrolase-like amidase
MRAALVSILRTLALVVLLGFFVADLGLNLAADRDKQGLGDRIGANKDHGIRVLLVDRGGPGTAGVTTRDKLQVNVLRPCLLVSPDEPDNPARTLPVDPGEQILVRPDGSDGLLLSSQTWGREQRWPVTRLRLQPRMLSPEPPNLSSPATIDPSKYESADHEAVFAFNGRSYRGSLEVIWMGPRQVMAVNALPLEVYLEGVIASEMSPSYPLEALKAQAIASRSYAYGRLYLAHHQPRYRGYDLTDSWDDDQEYQGSGRGNPLVTTAVVETRGLILVARGLPFVPRFCAASGGYCESILALEGAPRDITGRIDISSVMPAQPDPYCLPAAQTLGLTPRYGENTAVINATDIRRRLLLHPAKANDANSVGTIYGIAVVDRDERSGRVQRVAIKQVNRDKRSTIELSGHEFRMLLGPQQIRSTLWKGEPRKFDSDEKKGLYEIVTVGYGHGVGMSQISAFYMAREKGMTCREILAFFYPGSELETW